jgi:anti-sigma factor RsiW
LAATVLLAVAGVFMAGQQERLEVAFVAQLAIDHDKCFTEFGTGHPRLDAAQAEAQLAAKFGIDITVRASADGADLDLVDVRFCDYDGGTMAHLLYEVVGQPVSFFAIPGGQGERSLEVMGLQARLWSNDAAACVLLGREDVEVMDKVASYMQGYK